MGNGLIYSNHWTVDLADKDKCRLKEKKTQREREREKNLFTMTLGGFMIVVRNNSFIDSKIAFFRAYLVTILKALIKKGIFLPFQFSQ